MEGRKEWLAIRDGKEMETSDLVCQQKYSAKLQTTHRFQVAHVAGKVLGLGESQLYRRLRKVESVVLQQQAVM